MSEHIAPHCFKYGQCRDPQGERLKSCPPRSAELASYVDKTPSLLAEQLCLSGIGAYQESRARDPFKDRFFSLCYDLDRAIALPPGPVDEMKAQLFHQVIQMMKETQEETDIFSKSRLPYYLKIRQIGLFMPAFRARIAGTPIDPETVAHVHHNLCAWLTDFDDTFLDNLPKNAHREKKMIISHRTELEVQGLITRSGQRVAFPALQREEASHVRSEYNHDLYDISGDEKIPIQVKESSNNSGYHKMVVIKHYDILRAMRRDPVNETNRWEPRADHPDFEWPSSYQFNQILKGTKPDPIGQLLIEENEQGRYFDPAKRNALNLASSYVNSRIEEYKKKHLAK